MKQAFNISIALISALYVLVFLRHPRRAIVQMANTCTVLPGGTYREHGPWPYMYPVCISPTDEGVVTPPPRSAIGYSRDPYAGGGREQDRIIKEQVRALATHMRLHAPKHHHMLDASDFGSNVRVVLVVDSDEILINPEPVPVPSSARTGVVMTECHDFYHGRDVVKHRPSRVDVVYMDLDWRARTRRFEHGDACLIQTLMEAQL